MVATRTAGTNERCQACVLRLIADASVFLCRTLLLTMALALTLRARADEAASSTGTLLVRVRNGPAPVSSAEVSSAGLTVRTDSRGEGLLTLPAGDQEVSVDRTGFASVKFTVTVREGEELVRVVQLQQVQLEEQVTVVASTRSGTVIEDQPLRVEALPQEEIEENATIAPGNLTALLNELGGVRVQTSAPTLGGSELRLQGLKGRYTQILTDELPLYGAQSDSFGLLQIPPLDLAQVEVIKGAGTALYGGSSLGGIVNLVSRRPGGEPTLLANLTSTGGADAAAFVPGLLGGRWGYTLLASAHRQSRRDLDDDGWLELPGYGRGVLRPRLYWDDGAGQSFFATLGGMTEDREGGTDEGAVTPAGEPFRDTLETRHYDGGLVARLILGERMLAVHASWTGTWRDRERDEVRERDDRQSALVEISLAGTSGVHTWVAGTAFQDDSLKVRDVPGLDYAYRAPALFVQDEVAFSEKM